MPTPRQVHLDSVLTNISIAYIQKAEDFIAHRVFPVIPVQKKSDRYYVYPKSAWFRDDAAKRAPGAPAKRVGFEVDNTPTYYCEEWALASTIPDEERANADKPLDPDRDHTEFLVQKLMIRRERLWAESYFRPGVWGLDLTGVDSNPGSGQFLRWDNSNSNPFKLVKDLKLQMREQTGFEPNTLVLGPYVYNALTEHPEAIDRIKYTQQGVVTKDLLAALFEIPNIYVGKATVNLAREGAQDVFSFIHGKHALLCYVEPNPGLRKPSAGYTFAWRGLNPGFDMAGIAVSSGREPDPTAHADYVEARMAFDMKVVAPDLGIFLANAVA